MVRERQRYRVFDRGALIAEGTASECAAAAGLKPRTVQAYAREPYEQARFGKALEVAVATARRRIGAQAADAYIR